MSLFIESMGEIVKAIDTEDSRLLRTVMKKTGIGDSTEEDYNDLLESIEDWFTQNSRISNGNQFVSFRDELFLFGEDELGTYCKAIGSGNTMYSRNIKEFNEIYNLYD